MLSKGWHSLSAPRIRRALRPVMSALLIAMVAISSNAALAQSPRKKIGGTTVVPPEGGSVALRYNGATEVAGQSMLGVVPAAEGAEPGASSLPDRVYLFKPRPNATLCVVFSTIDGRLAASALYRTGSAPDLYFELSVPWPAGFGDYRSDEVVVAASYQPACSGPDGPPLLALWGSADRHVHGLAINPGSGMDAFFYRRHGDQGERVNCVPTTSGRAVVYTTICWLTADELTAAGGITIHTEDDGGGAGAPIVVKFAN